MFFLPKQTVHSLAVLAISMCYVTSLQAQTEHPATLSGHVVIPAMTFVSAPADAPSVLQTSGKFTTGKRVEELNSIEGLSAGRPTDLVAFQLRRSKGYEGMAASTDGTKLYPLLEGALWDETTKSYEAVDGKQYLRIVEFDVKTNKWTGRHWKYVMEGNHHAIGDFNMIDATTGLIIERDNGEGTEDKACPAGQRRTDCFHDLAKFKRIYKVELSDANAGGPVRKIAFCWRRSNIDHRGCGGKVGLLGGSPCTHTKTEFEQLSSISSSINASQRPLFSWATRQRTHSRLGIKNMNSDKMFQWAMRDLG